jgi:hypothetical protein
VRDVERQVERERSSHVVTIFALCDDIPFSIERELEHDVAGAARSWDEQDAGSWQPVRCGEVWGGVWQGDRAGKSQGTFPGLPPNFRLSPNISMLKARHSNPSNKRVLCTTAFVA